MQPLKRAPAALRPGRSVGFDARRLDDARIQRQFVAQMLRILLRSAADHFQPLRKKAFFDFRIAHDGIEFAVEPRNDCRRRFGRRKQDAVLAS